MSRLHQVVNQATYVLDTDIGYLERDPAGAQTDYKYPMGTTPGVDRRWNRGSAPNALDDEFGDGALDPAFTRVDSAGEASHLTWTEEAGCLSASHVGTDASAELHGLVKPMGAFSIGQSIQTCLSASVLHTSSPMAGLVLSDGATAGAGNQVLAALYTNVNAPYRWGGPRRHTGWNVNAASQDAALGGFTASPLHMRLTWAAANSFQMFVSPNGVSWMAVFSAQAYTLTPTHMGLFVTTWNSANDAVWSFDYFRVV